MCEEMNESERGGEKRRRGKKIMGREEKEYKNK